MAGKAISVALSIGSFIFLLQFGLSLVHADKRKRMKWTVGTYAAVCIFWIAFMGLRGLGSNMQALRQVELVASNTFGLIGGLVAAYGMDLYSREIKNVNYAASRNFHYAGILFAFFAFFESFIFSDIAQRFRLPTELSRTGVIVLTAYFIMKALNIFDVETRKKVEDQARRLVQSEKLASLGQLAAGIAHEINNPLANASLGLHLLRSKLVNSGGQPLVEQINAVEKNIDRAAEIAQELQLFARERQTAFATLNINEVIAGALTLTKYKLKKVVLEQNLAMVPDVMGDYGKLIQVFINVLSNALEAMPGGGRISISTSLRDNMVEARIVDTGIGIAEENLSKVFEPFFTTKEVGSGTGLGLSISYGIIQQHQGHIKITSTVGQGTTVIIQIPTAVEAGLIVPGSRFKVQGSRFRVQG